jgi:hypothetical protein
MPERLNRDCPILHRLFNSSKTKPFSFAVSDLGSNVGKPSSSGLRLEGRHPEVFFVRKEVSVSKNLERWKELAALCLIEQDPAKLTDLAREMNLVLTQGTPAPDTSIATGGEFVETERSRAG